MDPACANRNLLFGLLALQNGLINQGQLVTAFQAWTLDADRPLARHLVCRGDFNEEDCHVVEALVSRHLKKHGDRVEDSLATVSRGQSLRDTLARSAGSRIEPTLGFLDSAVGWTENGQANRAHGQEIDHTANAQGDLALTYRFLGDLHGDHGRPAEA